ncbi:MAG: metal-dependent transcriptional regulator [Butyrivibrio sp.]|nr:metal-dependent transcriptional regulator [Butyrivibrio sp.]
MKNILVLLKRNGAVRSVDIADEMGVTRPSVCNAMKKMRDENLIYFNGKGLIFFTDEGKVIAEKAYRKHALLTKALMGIGVKESIAVKEACSIEHVISDETYEWMK